MLPLDTPLKSLATAHWLSRVPGGSVPGASTHEKGAMLATCVDCTAGELSRAPPAAGRKLPLPGSTSWGSTCVEWGVGVERNKQGKNEPRLGVATMDCWS